MKLTNHCYAVVGLGYIPPWTVNSGFIVGKEKTLFLDTGPHAHVAETIYGYASAIRPENQMLAINLEKHLDHIGGNSLFVEKGIQIAGHPLINRQPEDLTGEIGEYNSAIPYPVRQFNNEAKLIYSNTILANPTQHLQDNTTFDLGTLKVKIIYTPGHTETNISAFVEGEGVLYSADCIVNGYIPNLEAGNKEDWKSWLSSLRKIRILDPKIIIPGHGKVIFAREVKSAIDRVENYLIEAIDKGYPPTLLQP